MTKTYKEKLKQRMMDKVEKVNGCWLFRGCLNSWGYGQVRIQGRTLGAHKVMFELENGKIPKGKQANHTCHVCNCINPQHIYVGTQKENVRDMIEAGRSNYAVGERIGQAKLNGKDIIKIRGLIAAGLATKKGLARTYKVHRATIQAIVKRTTWKHIK